MSMELVSTVTVGSGGAASIEFTNIPQTGKDLYCVMSVRSTGSGTLGDFLVLRLNGDNLNSNYFTRVLRGNGSGVGVDSWSSVGLYPGDAEAAGQTVNTFANNTFYVSNYTSSATKAMQADSVTENEGINARQQLLAGHWNGTSAITNFKLETTSFVQYSTASLYIIS